VSIFYDDTKLHHSGGVRRNISLGGLGGFMGFTVAGSIFIGPAKKHTVPEKGLCLCISPGMHRTALSLFELLQL
jgi:hypothetical protein